METSSKEKVVNQVRRTLRFQYSIVVYPEGIAGGLAILWDEKVEIEVDESS
ncbi:Fe2OG dioxygenase domain-containing protein [Psidium guajava]|nr:Fe2OG dioxygenase domain-containing protein [Psidium guajava]